MTQLAGTSTRRAFVARAGQLAAGASLLAATTPAVHAAEKNTIQIALVGAGNRGTGAACNALSVENGPIKLVALADVFAERLPATTARVMKVKPERVDLPDERKFVGFDSYKQAMDCLRPGDIVILTAPPAFRPMHFAYAIEKRLNVFMEKPITVDGPSTRRMLALGEKSVAANLKVGVGLMSRHCPAREDLVAQIRQGKLGDILAMRTYRMHAPVGSFVSFRKPPELTELMYQIKRFHSFLWASGGCYSDFYIHNIDECCWMKDAWPVSAEALGGRHYRGESVDQNLDTYSVEYAFADGTKLFMFGRNMPGCFNRFQSYLHATKGMAVITECGRWPGVAAIYEGQQEDKDRLVWKSTTPKANPYLIEWERLVAAVRDDKPHNEVERGAQASLVSNMGRMAAHTGQVITYQQALEHEHDMAPGIEQFTATSVGPLPADANGRYPVPQPGIQKDREY